MALNCSDGGSGLPHNDDAQDVVERIDSESERFLRGEICTCFSICKRKYKHFNEISTLQLNVLLVVSKQNLHDCYYSFTF